MKHTLGRPFYSTTEEGGAAAVVAPLVLGSTGWLDGQQELLLFDTSSNTSRTHCIDEPSNTQRAAAATRLRISEHWASNAAAEHASVGAFHKHSLELLSIGAPVHLLRGAARAASDEIEHAALSFALASAYQPDQKAIGPGGLAAFAATARAGSTTTTSSSSAPTDLTRVALSTARDGAVHETLAAIEALVARRCASDDAVVSALTVISNDEARHAVLAWEVLQWAVEMQPSRGTLLAETIEEEEARIDAEAGVAAAHAEVLDDGGSVAFPCAAQEEEELRRAGVLSEAQRAWAHAITMERVIRPAVMRLRQGDESRGGGGAGVAKEVAMAIERLLML